MQKSLQLLGAASGHLMATPLQPPGSRRRRERAKAGVQIRAEWHRKAESSTAISARLYWEHQDVGVQRGPEPGSELRREGGAAGSLLGRRRGTPPNPPSPVNSPAPWEKPRGPSSSSPGTRKGACSREKRRFFARKRLAPSAWRWIDLRSGVCGGWGGWGGCRGAASSGRPPGPTPGKAERTHRTPRRDLDAPLSPPLPPCLVFPSWLSD